MMIRSPLSFLDSKTVVGVTTVSPTGRDYHCSRSTKPPPLCHALRVARPPFTAFAGIFHEKGWCHGGLVFASAFTPLAASATTAVAVVAGGIVRCCCYYHGLVLVFVALGSLGGGRRLLLIIIIVDTFGRRLGQPGSRLVDAKAKDARYVRRGGGERIGHEVGKGH